MADLRWFKCPVCGSTSGMTPAEAGCVNPDLIRCMCGEELSEIPDPIAAARREKAFDWRPIETAPRDGTRVIIYREGHAEDMCLCWWWDEVEEWQAVHGAAFLHATHWMPAPEPPGSALTRLVDTVEREIRNGRGPGDPADCPGGHGDQCCGWIEDCRQAMEGRGK